MALACKNVRYTFIFPMKHLNAEVFIQRIEGEHRINQGFRAEIICLSTNVTFGLKAVYWWTCGSRSSNRLGTTQSPDRCNYGASQGQSDGALTVYKLVIEDATALWHKRRNSRVFMNKSVRGDDRNAV